jgi:hypothetical protein
MLEQLARDTTGWNARAVEFFELLGTTQYLNHLRPENHRTPDIRQGNRMELLDTPFDAIAHTADVRRIANRRGKHNIPNVGIFLWRLQAYRMEKAAARSLGNGRFTFSQLGRDMTLFNQPQTETDIAHIAEEVNVPGMLRRRLLFDELEILRRNLAEGKTKPVELLKECIYFGDRPVLEIFLPGSGAPISPEQIMICDLSKWDAAGWQPPASQTFKKPDGTIAATTVSIDPMTGRIAFVAGAAPAEIWVSYSYGFSGDIGGGPYDRRESILQTLEEDKEKKVDWQAGVSKSPDPVDGELIRDNITDVIKEWNKQPAGTRGIITIMDNGSYTAGNEAIEIPEGSSLLVIAADWPPSEKPDLPGQEQRKLGAVTPARLRPHVQGDLSAKGTATPESTKPGTLTMNGLLIEGKMTVKAGNLGSLQLSHCTLVPEKGGLQIESLNRHTQVTLDGVICGPVDLADDVPVLSVRDSIIDAGGGTAISAPEAECELQAVTIFGSSKMQQLESGNCIYTNKIFVEQRQSGCMRFSYVPDGSRTPRRYRCQPDLALNERARELQKDSAADLPASEKTYILGRLTPAFTSTHYGDPAYGQLGIAGAVEIRTGAEEEREMGAFYYLKRPQREKNLLSSLDEYLRFGLEAGVYYVT